MAKLIGARPVQKDIVINSLKYLVLQNQIKLYAFVIMPNHVHLIWHIQTDETKDKVQQRFLKFTAQQFKKELKCHWPNELEKFHVSIADRKYQFWQRNSLSIALDYDDIFHQKLEYIHLNPTKKQLCLHPENYKYSSAKFYYYGIDEFGILTHFNA